jgi:hypothetical protein
MSLEDIIERGTKFDNAGKNNIVTCKDGFTMSVIAHWGAYCSPRPSWCKNSDFGRGPGCGECNDGGLMGEVDCGFTGPYLGDATGALYLHETGTTYAEESGSTLTPYIESGPLEFGDGGRVFTALEYIPDGNTTTGVTLTLLSSFYPTASETTNGPYTAANPTNFRITARQVRAKLTQSTAGWRFGTPRLRIEPGGER